MKKIILIAVAFLTLYSAAFAKNDGMKNLDSSVVRIVTSGGHGSGFFINKDGHILTNAHVVFDLQKEDVFPNILVLHLLGDDIYLYKAKIEGKPSIEKDLAVLKINTLHAKPIRFARKAFDKPDDVIAVGFSGTNDDQLEESNFLEQAIEFQPSNSFIEMRDAFLREKQQAEEKIKQLQAELEKRHEEAKKNNFEHSAEFLQEVLKITSQMEALGASIIEKGQKLDMRCRQEVEEAMEILPDCKKVAGSLKKYAEPVIQKGEIEKISYFSEWGLLDNQRVKVIQHNAAIRGGNSGGPLLNANRQLIGVNTRGKNDDPDRIQASLSLSSHLDEIVDYLKQNNIRFRYAPVLDSEDIVLVAIFVVGILLLIILIIKIRGMSAKDSNEASAARGAGGANTHMSPPRPVAGLASEGPRDYGARQNVRIEFSGASGAAYKFLVDGQKLDSCENYIILGRNGDFCDVCIAESSISSQHLGISVKQDSIYIEDRNSSNGSYVGNTRLQAFKPVKISPSETVKIGALTGRILLKEPDK